MSENNKQVRRSSFVGTTISTAKSEFESRLSAIDQNVVAALKAGSLNTVDSIFYSVCAIEGNTTKELMQSGDSKAVGKTNINKRQLEANCYALITGIQLLQSTADVESSTDLSNLEWERFNGSLANGELELKNGDKVILPRNSCEVFRTPDGSDKPMGFYQLACPKFIVPLTDIIPTLWLPVASSRKAVKIVFYGVKTNKA